MGILSFRVSLASHVSDRVRAATHREGKRGLNSVGIYGHRISELFYYTTIKNVTRWKTTPPCWLNMKAHFVLVARSTVPLLRPGAVSASASRPDTRAHEERSSVARKGRRGGNDNLVDQMNSK